MSDRENVPREDEIDIYRYWQVLCKRWKLIFAIVLVAVGSTFVVSRYLPKVYRVTAIINLGHIEMDGRVVPVANLADIQQIIGAGSFTKKIITSLGLTESRIEADLASGITTETPPTGENILIKYDTANPTLGVRVLNQLIVEIQSTYNHRAENYRKSQDAQIAKLNESIKTLGYQQGKIDLGIQKLNQEIEKKDNTTLFNINMLNHEKKGTQAQIKQLHERIQSIAASRDKLRHVSVTLEQNTQQLLKDKSRLAQTVDKENILASILFANTLQQNINFLNLDYDQIKRYEVEISEVQEQIEKLNTDLKILDEKINQEKVTRGAAIKDLNVSIREQTLQKEKDIPAEIGKVKNEIAGIQAHRSLIEGIETLAIPDHLINPIKPQRRVLVAGAGGISLMVGVLLAFLLEWQRDNEVRGRQNEKSSSRNS